MASRSMSCEVEEAEIFEDFTTASDWERFVAALEEVVREWNLPQLHSHRKVRPLSKGELSSHRWEQKCQTVSVGSYVFQLTRHFLRHHEQAEEDEGDGEEEEESPLPVALADILATENDFAPRAHHLVRWYGLRDLMVLSPVNGAMESESMTRLVLSSALLALSNSRCRIPLFLLLRQGKSLFYQGVCQGGGVQTHFDMVLLNRIPPNCNHLAGLLDMFKCKLASACPMSPVRVSIRFTYAVSEWTWWPKDPPEIGAGTGGGGPDDDDPWSLGHLPFGAYEEPLAKLVLYSSWPQLTEDVLVDADSYSDLDPLQAPKWSLRAQSPPHTPACLLSDCISETLALCRRRDSFQQVLGRSLLDSEDDKDPSIALSLDRLADSHSPYSSVLRWTVGAAADRNTARRGSSRRKTLPDLFSGPIPKDQLTRILFYLFPDAQEANPNHPYPEPLGTWNQPDDSIFAAYKEQLQGLKSCPRDGLVWRLCITLAHCLTALGGLPAAAHLWQEVVLELRFRWDNSILVPGLEPGSPNLGTCLLNQKLQMLNCCIEKRRQREQAVRATSDGAESSNDKSDTSSDEFYECTSDPEESEELGVSSSVAAAASATSPPPSARQLRRRSTLSLWNRPIGRLRKCGNLRLLEADDALYIPVTQEPAPMTEDQLEELAEVLVRLGTDGQGSELRARMMSASLLSDMEAFKAANPRSTLEDFVRWYSPRDWIEDDSCKEEASKDDTVKEGNVHIMNTHDEMAKGDSKDDSSDETVKEFSKDDAKGDTSAEVASKCDMAKDGVTTGSSSCKGMLSSRMQIPGNMWREVWDSAKPVPAKRQKRLFDDTKEAEKVLHFLAVKHLRDVGFLALPALVTASIWRLIPETQSVKSLKSVSKLLAAILIGTTKATRMVRRDTQQYEEVCRDVAQLEAMVAQAGSLKSKLVPDESDLATVLSLLEEPEVEIPGGSRGKLGKAVAAIFSESERSKSDDLQDGATTTFPAPLGKEFILRSMATRPAPYSTPTPQRLFCTLTRDEFRLCGAFSHDITFQ